MARTADLRFNSPIPIGDLCKREEEQSDHKSHIFVKREAGAGRGRGNIWQFINNAIQGES